MIETIVLLDQGNEALAAAAEEKRNTVLVSKVILVKMTRDKGFKIPSLPLLERFNGALHVSVKDHALLIMLSKAGLRTPAEFLRSANTFMKKASADDIKLLLPDAARKTLMAKLKAKIYLKKSLKIAKPGQTVKKMYAGAYEATPAILLEQNALFNSLISLYAYLAAKVCSATALPYDPAVVTFLLLGTGKVDRHIKSLGSKKVKALAEKAVDSTLKLKIEDLKPRDFKTHDPLLASRLPDLYADYAARHEEKKTSSARVTTDSGKRWAAIRARRKYQYETLPEMLRKEVGEEMFVFLSLLVPKLRAAATKATPEALKQIREIEKKTQTYNYPALRNINRARVTAVRKRAIEEARRSIKANKLLLKSLKRANKEAKEKRTKAWMVPYMSAMADLKHVRGAKTATLDDGILRHRLVVRANANKIKEGDVELTVKLDKANALLLTYKGVAKIVDACDGSTVAACQTVFSEVIKEIKSKLFTIGMMDRNGGGLDTATGKVTDQRLLRLNSITLDDEKTLSAQFKKNLVDWDPLQTGIKEVISKINNSKEVKEAHYEVTKSSPKQLAAYRKDLPQFMSHLHDTDMRIMKSWEVKLSPKIAAVLKNAKKTEGLKVIRNVFHGCSKQAGSIILHSGFKISGTQVTGRAMGDVLYVAPCVDKSAQYMGKKGFTRGEGTIGIVFMGDILIAGTSTAKASEGKGFGWTKIGFKTEEIGLTNPNMQFIIKHVFMLKITKNGNVGKKNAQLASFMTKFESPVPASQLKQT